MKPQDIYDSKVISSTFDLNLALPFFHEISCFEYEERNSRLVTKDHLYHFYDYRRIAVIRSVWLDGVPFMIIRKAGRDGDDFQQRLITDETCYKKALKYLLSLCVPDLADDSFSPEQDLEELNELYRSPLVLDPVAKELKINE